MHYLALARFRMLTILRTSTGIFIICLIPCAFFAVGLSTITEPIFRTEPWEFLRINASFAICGWVFHGVFIAFAAMLTGKVKSAYDDVTIGVKADLMDLAPVSPGERFWGEALGTFAAMALIHLCTLPLLSVLAALCPLPTSAFLWIELVIIACVFLASASAAWQRRAPRTKFSATRGPRNAIVIAILLLSIVPLTTRWVAFRDALTTFMQYRVSPKGWADVVGAVDNPLLMVTLVSLLYLGTMTYYYVSATRKRALEN